MLEDTLAEISMCIRAGARRWESVIFCKWHSFFRFQLLLPLHFHCLDEDNIIAQGFCET